MLESIMQVASGRDTTRPRLVVGPRDAALRAARTCYDHLAGRLGVALADVRVEDGHVELASDGGLVTDAGSRFFRPIGIDLDSVIPRSGKRPVRLAVPAVPRLERTTPSSRRHYRRSNMHAQLCGGLDTSK
jgi:hypothetical protein